MTFVAEMLIGNPSRALYPTSLRNASPDSPVFEMSSEERARVVGNIAAYFERNRITYEVVE